MAVALSGLLKATSPAGRPGRLRTRLTAAGWGFLGLMLCGFLMSVNFSNNLIFAMTFLLAGVALVGWWQTRANLRGLALSGWRCEPVFAGQAACYRLALENPSRVDRHALRACSRGLAAGAELSIAARQRTELIFSRPAPARGLLPPVVVLLESRFPLGLFRASLETGMLPEVVVYPAAAGSQPLPDQARGQQAHLARESGSFTGMRRYASGDSPARIDWRALARSDQLYTREFDGAEGRPSLWLDAQDVRRPDPESRLSQLCRWVLEAHRQGREYGLEIGEMRLAPANDEAHKRRCLRVLALHGRSEPAGSTV